MERRRKNNIIIGTLCCVLVLMGVGYAILSTTLNIGGTANITGDFDIHFLDDDQNKKGISLIDYDNSTSGNTIYNTTVNNTIAAQMESGTEVDSQDSTNATFSAILQKPTDYAIFTVTVKNYGSIDGYLTFSFEDTNDNFSYYDDFYSVEFIKEGSPDIKADILQNQSFTDNAVLSSGQSREYKIKVTFKESATSFPDTTTNGEFECALILTYSQQAPSGGNSGGNTESNLTWYAGDLNGMQFAVAFEQVGQNMVLRHQIMNGTDFIGQAGEHIFVPYNPITMANLETHIGVSLQEGDYVEIVEGIFYGAIHGETVYSETPDGSNYIVESLSLDPTGSLEKYLSSGNNNESDITWYTKEVDGEIAAIGLDSDKNWKFFYIDDKDAREEFAGLRFISYDSSQTIDTNYLGNLQDGDYITVFKDGGQTCLLAILRNNTIIIQFDMGEGQPIFTFDLNSDYTPPTP